ncbi:MAG: acetylornithine transaminase [Thermoplasmatota archaeon]
MEPYNGAAWEAVMAPNYTTPTIELVRGQGATVWDSTGRRYTDLLAGIAVNILGHGHPAIVEAVTRQIKELGHTSNLYANPPSLELAGRLHAATGLKVLFQNSGTEANEAALKLVRRHAHAVGIPQGLVVAFDNSFHGRTTGALALTGQGPYREGFQPLPGQVLHAPFNDVAALEKAFEEPVAGVFFEAIQGEGGVVPMEPDFAAALSRLSRANGSLLVADEIQTGLGRTGSLLACEQWKLTPDVVTLAKGLGGGLPLGATLIAERHAARLGPGSHGTTFGGNPVTCAAGNAVMQVLSRDRLAERAKTLGRRMQEALAEVGLPVRGRGLLMGIPLAAPKAPAVAAQLRERSYLVGQAGKSVVRMAPPLIIEEAALMGAAPAIAAAVQSAG